MQQNKNLRELKNEIIAKNERRQKNMYYQIVSKSNISLERVSYTAKISIN